MFDFLQKNNRVVVTILVLGALCVTLGLWGRLAAAASTPKGVPGSYLSLANYVTAQYGSDPETIVGAYLGPYSVSVNHCETFHIVGDELQCYHSENGELKLTPENLTESGYGLLVLRYPNDMCEGGGVCFASPTIMLLIPLKSGGDVWQWELYQLQKSNGVSGHVWGPPGGFMTFSGNVKMKTMLIDYKAELLPSE